MSELNEMALKCCCATCSILMPCEIAEAANGRDALEYLKEHTADILLTDVKMPFMDGIQLIEECKKDDRNEDMKCVSFRAAVSLTMPEKQCV